MLSYFLIIEGFYAHYPQVKVKNCGKKYKNE